jgi:hypothetical protein
MTTMQTADVRDKLLRVWDYLDSVEFADDGERTNISDAAAFIEDAVNEVVGYCYF